MDGETLRLLLELLRTAASVAVPFVLVWAAHRLQKRQKLVEATMAEKARHYAALSPLLNVVFSYRMRVGDFLDRTPESVLEAKRKADHEFWTFEYLWSNQFRQVYHEFMGAAFQAFNAEGTKALVRADGALYPVKPADPNWAGFTGEPVDRGAWVALYAKLKGTIARDLGFADFETGLRAIKTEPPG
ncbi:MAG: hypothetical protein K2V38_04430 [Gemmataceae bacterium]|nr:hypothetical protein [Gemmataceae bacterium]